MAKVVRGKQIPKGARVRVTLACRPYFGRGNVGVLVKHCADDDSLIRFDGGQGCLDMGGKRGREWFVASKRVLQLDEVQA